MMVKELKLEEISKDLFSGHDWKQYYVITDFITWNNLWRTTFSKTSPVPKLPEVNFSKEMVFAVYFGEHKVGYEISIDKIVETEKEVIVEVIEKYSFPGEIVSKVFCSPHHIVKTEKIDKEVDFERSISRSELD